jgi:hypothetical protein
MAMGAIREASPVALVASLPHLAQPPRGISGIASAPGSVAPWQKVPPQGTPGSSTSAL